MKINKLNIVIVIGLIAITGILVVQLLWTKQAYSAEETKFGQKVHIALLQVVNKLYEYNEQEYPLKNPINKISNDYYVVNVNNDFDAQVLEYCLRTEFEKAHLLTDFEYAIYKCESDEMVYGNYISFSDKANKKPTFFFPKQDNLVYYFAIRFPNETSYLFSSMKFWFILSAVLLIILLIYVYSVFTIIQQRKYSELQRDFINNMTHEFKTPLSSILIASNYMAKHKLISEDEKLSKYADIIVSQGTKLNQHIEKILNIARSDNSVMKLEMNDVDVNKLIHEVISGMQLKHSNLVIDVHTDNNTYVIRADEFHLTNVLYNLLDNSIKYCNKAPHIHISMSHDEGSLKISVADNGIGIPEEKLGYIFDRFYRVSGQKHNVVNGFGLGLYYVRKICVLHGWRIEANNNDNQGVTVTITIPLK